MAFIPSLISNCSATALASTCQSYFATGHSRPRRRLARNDRECRWEQRSAAARMPSFTRSPTSMVVRLGESETYVSEIGCGTIAWGDKAKGYDKTFAKRDLFAAVKYLANNGVNFFDCAEVYGRSEAENILGDALAQPEMPSGAVLSTKFFPLPWTAIVGVGGGVRLGRQAVREALRYSLTRLGAASVDLYYIHFPFPLPGLVDGMADCVDAGIVRHVGVSNYNRQQLKDVHAAFAARNVRLASNQFRFNILDRSAEISGLLEETLSLGVTPVAYEPLAQGLLTGKYTENETSPGSKYSLQQLKLVKQLTNLMKFVGAVGARGEPRSITEVALAYCISKGVVAIPGIKNEGQAREAVRALNWAMSRDIVETLDEKSDYIVRQQGRMRS